MCLASTPPSINGLYSKFLCTDLCGRPPLAALLSRASRAVCAGSTLAEVDGCGVGACDACSGGVGVVVGFAVVVVRGSGMIAAGFTTLSDSDTKSKPDGSSVRYSQFIRKHKIK